VVARRGGVAELVRTDAGVGAVVLRTRKKKMRAVRAGGVLAEVVAVLEMV